MYECIMYVQNLGMAFRAWSLLPMAPSFQQGWRNKKLFIPLFRRFQTGTLWFRLTSNKPKGKKRGWFSGKSPTATLHPPSCIKHHVMQKPPTIQPVNKSPSETPRCLPPSSDLSSAMGFTTSWLEGCSAAHIFGNYGPFRFNGGNTQKGTHYTLHLMILPVVVSSMKDHEIYLSVRKWRGLERDVGTSACWTNLEFSSSNRLNGANCSSLLVRKGIERPEKQLRT